MEIWLLPLRPGKRRRHNRSSEPSQLWLRAQPRVPSGAPHLPCRMCGDALAAEGVGAAELDRATLGAADVHAHSTVLLAATVGARAPRALLHLGLLPESVRRACQKAKMLRLRPARSPEAPLSARPYLCQDLLALRRLLSASGRRTLLFTWRSTALPATSGRGSTLGLLEPGRGALHQGVAPLHRGQRGARRRPRAAALHQLVGGVVEITG